MATPKKVTVRRRSDNGQFTTEKYTKAHPRTTETQKVRRVAPKKK